MSHDTHDHNDSHDTGKPMIEKSRTGLQSSFLLIVIIAGLFICAINFMSAMGHAEAGHEIDGHEMHKVNSMDAAHGAPHGVTEPDPAAMHTADESTSQHATGDTMHNEASMTEPVEAGN